MLFNSLSFLIFFPIVVLIYFLIPVKVKNFWLLIASYYFYMCWNAKYALLIFFVTIITFSSALLIEKIKNHNENNKKKAVIFNKIIIAVCIVITILILLYYKYFNFFISMCAKLLECFHIQLYMPGFDILLPVGISFYTFQALSYTIDVYRGEANAEKNFFQYALFVAFFPQLVAGPIERSKNLLKQLAQPKRFDSDCAREGFWLMLWGFFLKIVVADRIAIFVDAVYGDYVNYTGWYLIVATILFALQIYCDFYGYSVIAMGAARILNIQLMENFNAPYLSTSVAAFWRNWHISLTTWFKDYLYIPLGGSRKGKIRKYVNKLIVFSVSGLWHGASLSYVVWGGLNGLYQIAGEILLPFREKLARLLKMNRNSIGCKLISAISTFLLVDFAWIFFRADSLKESFEIIRQMFSFRNPWILFDGALYQCGLDKANWQLMLVGVCILLFADCCKRIGVEIRKVIAKQDYWCRFAFTILVVFLIMLFGIWGPGYNEANFIYFQF